MSFLIKSLYDLRDWYIHVNYDLPDARVKEWFLVDSPFIVFSIIVSYLLFVYKFGPQFMKNRKPFNVEKIQIVYNMSQILLLASMLYLGLPAILKLNLLCSPINYSTDPEDIMYLRIGWGYYIIKIVDLIDTVFIVLKKNDRQASFLHVYHHGSMVFCSWACLRYFGGGHVSYIPFVNSIVHVIMYMYYLICTLCKIKNPWWKKYITQIQLLQFTLMFVIYVPPYLLSDCTFPKALSLGFLIYNCTMVTLFGNFYYRAYIKPKNKKE